MRVALQRLRQAAWLRDADTQRVFTLLDGTRGTTRAVGGVVRDTIADRVRDVADIDFATELLPDEVMRRAAAAGLAAYPTGIEHGTVTLRIGERTFEVTTLREDVETDGRRATVRFGFDWTRDAERRDFTLNALYCDMDGDLLDPVGGAEDCLNGVVRFIGDARRRIAEDRLRVYRFFRFSASHGGERFDEDGLTAVREAAGSLAAVSAERIGHEMRRMLALPQVARTIEAMMETGVMPVPPMLPRQLGLYERLTTRPTVNARVALFIQTVGSAGLKTRWRMSNDEIALAEATLLAAKLVSEFRLNEAVYRYPGTISDAVEVAATLSGWTQAGRAVVVDHLEQVEVPRFPLSGGDLLAKGMRPGPKVGAELERLEKRWIQSGFTLDKNALLSILQR